MSAIKEIRREQNLTQQQAAELIGISIRSFKSYENDETGFNKHLTKVE